MHDNHSKPSFRQIVISVLAAMFGVQSDKARQRDFTQGNPLHYIIVGVVFVIVFVLGLYALVQFILSQVLAR